MLNYGIREFLASISGVLLCISFPRIGFGWCAWCALVPLFIALRMVSIKRAFQIGVITGITHYLILINWVVFALNVYGNVKLGQSILILVLLSLYLSMYPAIFSMFVVCFCKKPFFLLIIAPSVWVVLEFLRSILFTGFPWELIGYSQFKYLYFIQISDLFGVYGVSFLLVMFNVFIFIVFLFFFGCRWNGIFVHCKNLYNSFLVVAVVFVLVFSYGFWKVVSIEKCIEGAKKLKIAVIQGNINQSVKWNPAFQIASVKKYIHLSSLAIFDSPDLVVWPETAMPFHFSYNFELTNLVLDAVKKFRSNFIIGSTTISNKPETECDFYYNSAYLVNVEGRLSGRYDKVHLVPLGEYVPFGTVFPFFNKLAFQVNGFEAGVSGNVLRLGCEYESFGIQICYEIIFPKLSRSIVNSGAKLLINITNDAWFGKSGAPYQHFSMAIFRAIENRRSLIRSANTGISGFINPVGRVLVKTAIFEEKILIQKIPIFCFKTLYTIYGDFFVLSCSVVIIVYVFTVWFYDSDIIENYVGLNVYL